MIAVGLNSPEVALSRKSTFQAPARYKSADKEHTLQEMDTYYLIVKKQLLQYQSCTSGLFPRYSDDNTVGYVRDSLYCATACWALARGYSRIDDQRGRQYELGGSAVKTMRGILHCWMSQAAKVEQFKNNYGPNLSLHSIFDLRTGQPVVDYDSYGHLQIDVVALFLLTLVQMISGGLEIIYTSDEVCFVQNMVFYIERAYRTPDFGMWECGTRYNDGTCELHASSIGMVKAALESINGFNLYGSKGTVGSVIYVDIDAHNRNRTTFETLLPRESNSKNVDASLIPTVLYPCFATHDAALCKRTIEKCIRKLKGKYGFKRFLRDGRFTVLEDKTSRLYRHGETKIFDGIECQWPLFFIYLIIDGIFAGDADQVSTYSELLEPLLIVENDEMIVPQYYFLPEEYIFHERCHPSSQPMLPSTMVSTGLFLWGQALYIICCLLREKLVFVSEIDPCYRHLPASQRPRFDVRHSIFQGSICNPVLQIALIAESQKLQTVLSTYGITCQTPHQVEPVQIWPSSQLVKVFESLGNNGRLGLTGRPPRPIGALGTSKIYRVLGNTVLCYPLLFEVSDFYLSSDPAVLIDDIKRDLLFVAQRWQLAGRPTYCVLLTEPLVVGEHFANVLDLLVDMKNGMCNNVRVRLGRVQNLLSAGCWEHLDFVPQNAEVSFKVESLKETESSSDFSSLSNLKETECMLIFDQDFDIKPFQNKSTDEVLAALKSAPTSAFFTKSKLLHLLLNRHGMDFKIEEETVRERLERICRLGARAKSWNVVRYCAALLRKVVDSLAPSITSILVRGKRVTIGVFGHEEIIIDKPVTPQEIEEALYSYCFPYDVDAAVLEQELIIVLGYFVSVEPELFAGMLKIRIGWLIHAMNLLLNYERDSVSQRSVNDLSPTEIKQELHDLLAMKHFSRLSPLQQRQLNGCLNRVPPDFYDQVWRVLERTPEGIVVAGHHLPQQPTLSDMTEYELNFALTIEELLSRPKLPEYRQVMVELFVIVSLILQRNPELHFSGQVNLDDLIHSAFEAFCKDSNIQDTSDMTPFFKLLPQVRAGTSIYLAKAVFNELLCTTSKLGGQWKEGPTLYDTHCILS